MDHPESSAMKSDVRRKTTLAKVLNLPKGEKLKIECDKSLLVNSIASHLSNWCGIIARDCQLFPLDRLTWHETSQTSKNCAWEMITQKIQQEIENREGSQDSISRDDVISTVLGVEKPGRIRGYGLGMTPTMLWGSSYKYGGPSATEFATVQGKIKEFDEKMKEKDVEMERKDVKRDAEMARRDAEMACQAVEMEKFKSIIDTLSAQASNDHIIAPQSTDGGNDS